ncbi:MAG TPA: hypothetical protein VMB51_05985 [Solirubrobacteraceae bacterium]|nr:hypothetical protein [Solirubrobacteraceae bacterium]
MKLLRMKPGHGEIVLAEGDVEVPEQERELIEAFRRELDEGMWAAVPIETNGGRREAELVKSFAEVPRDADRVIFFPRAAGGAESEARGAWRPAGGAELEARGGWRPAGGAEPEARGAWRAAGGAPAGAPRRTC